MNELNGLRKISEISISTSLVITPLSIVFSMITGSVTLVVYFVWSAAAFAVKLFALISIRIMLKENQFLYPFGTGKLENFSSFLFGVSIVPMGVYFLIVSILKLFAPLNSVAYLLCLIPSALSFLMTLLLFRYTNRIIRGNPNPSPLLKAYSVNFKVSLISDASLFFSFFAGFLLSAVGLHFFSLRVDPVLSALLSLYMIKAGLPLIINDVRALIDLPLPERDMLKILKVASEFYEQYSGFGVLYSRQSGKHKIIEMELLFEPATSLEKINALEHDMGLRIGELIPAARFNLRPKLMKN